MLEDLVIEPLVQPATLFHWRAVSPAHRSIRPKNLATTPEKPSRSPLFDLINLDVKPGCSIDPRFDVDLRFHVEAKLPPPRGCLRASTDSLRDGTSHRGMKFPFDLAGNQKPAGAWVNCDEPIRVYRTSIFVRPFSKEVGGSAVTIRVDEILLSNLIVAAACAGRPCKTTAEASTARKIHRLDRGIGTHSPRPSANGLSCEAGWKGRASPISPRRRDVDSSAPRRVLAYFYPQLTDLTRGMQ